MNIGTMVNAPAGGTLASPPAPVASNNGTTEKYCFQNDVNNCNSNHPNYPDGGLYSWKEAMQYVSSEGAQGICPVGWHIPTDAEWHILELSLKDDPNTCNQNRSTTTSGGAYDCANAGTKLIPGGTSGFEGNLAASFWWAFCPMGLCGRDNFSYFWTSTEKDASDAWYRVMSPYTPEANKIARISFTKDASMPVRCVGGPSIVVTSPSILQLCREGAPIAQGGGTYGFSLPTGSTTSIKAYYDNDVSSGHQCDAGSTDVTASTTFTEANPTGGALTLSASGTNPKTFTGSSAGTESVTVSYSGASITMNATVSCTETVNCSSEQASVCSGSTVPSGTTKAGTCGTVDCSNLPGTRYCDMNWKEVTPGF